MKNNDMEFTIAETGLRCDVKVVTILPSVSDCNQECFAAQRHPIQMQNIRTGLIT